MAFPFAAVAGVAQAGLGIFGGFSQRKQQAAEAAYNSTFQNLMIDGSNRMRRDIFSRQIDQYKTQQGFNADAANRAYSAEQRRLNEVFTQSAFQQQGMLESLMKVQGENNATERYGNSARRANLVESLGAFGRQQAVMAESLASARSQSSQNLAEISRQRLGSEYGNWQQIAIPPMMEVNTPPPRMSSGNSALMIGNALMGGFSTFNSLRAPSGGMGNSFSPMRSTFPTSTGVNTQLAFSLPRLA